METGKNIVFNNALYNEFQNIRCMDVKALSYFSNSCYLDTTLLALLFQPTRFVWENILIKDLPSKEMVTTQDQGGGISVQEECNVGEIQKELQNITLSLHGKLKAKVCTVNNLREFFKKCQLSGYSDFGSTTQQDPIELLEYLFLIFNIHLRESKEKRYPMYVEKYEYTSEGQIQGGNFIPPALEPQLLIDAQGTVESELLNRDDTNYELTVNPLSNTYADKDVIQSTLQAKKWSEWQGVENLNLFNTYKNKYFIDTSKSKTFPPLFINLNREDLKKVSQFSPEETVQVSIKGSSEKANYSLSRILVYQGTGSFGHYVMMYKCIQNFIEKWYYYNDNPPNGPPIIRILSNEDVKARMKASRMLMYTHTGGGTPTASLPEPPPFESVVPGSLKSLSTSSSTKNDPTSLPPTTPVSPAPPVFTRDQLVGNRHNCIELMGQAMKDDDSLKTSIVKLNDIIKELGLNVDTLDESANINQLMDLCTAVNNEIDKMLKLMPFDPLASPTTTPPFSPPPVAPVSPAPTTPVTPKKTLKRTELLSLKPVCSTLRELAKQPVERQNIITQLNEIIQKAALSEPLLVETSTPGQISDACMRVEKEIDVLLKDIPPSSPLTTPPVTPGRTTVPPQGKTPSELGQAWIDSETYSTSVTARDESEKSFEPLTLPTQPIVFENLPHPPSVPTVPDIPETATGWVESCEVEYLDLGPSATQIRQRVEEQDSMASAEAESVADNVGATMDIYIETVKVANAELPEDERISIGDLPVPNPGDPGYEPPAGYFDEDGDYVVISEASAEWDPLAPDEDDSTLGPLPDPSDSTLDDDSIAPAPGAPAVAPAAPPAPAPAPPAAPPVGPNKLKALLRALWSAIKTAGTTTTAAVSSAVSAIRAYFTGLGRPATPAFWNAFTNALSTTYGKVLGKLKNKKFSINFTGFHKKDKADKYKIRDYGLISEMGGTRTSGTGTDGVQTGRAPRATNKILEIVEPLPTNIAFKYAQPATQPQNKKQPKIGQFTQVYTFLDNTPIATVVMVLTGGSKLQGLYLKVGRKLNDNRWVRLNDLRSEEPDHTVQNEVWYRNIGKFIIPLLNIKLN
jgi:hypothetical protein